MINTKQKINPAWTAIAAVLAFGSTPALAQEATASPAPTTQAPSAAYAPLEQPSIELPPVITPVPATVESAPAPTVQPVPQTVEVPEIKLPPIQQETKQASSAPVAKAATQRMAPARITPSNNNNAQAEAAAAEAIAQTETITSSEIDPIVESVPVATAAAQEASAQTSENTTPWGLIAGIAALLLGGIAAAMMGFRRRKTSEEHPEFIKMQPLADIDGANKKEMTSAVVTEKTSGPAVSKPSPAYIPATSTRHAPANSSNLEQMVAAEPSADNPFLTYRKRLNRAKFILRQREVAIAKFDGNNADKGFVTTKPISRDAHIATRETEDA